MRALPSRRRNPGHQGMEKASRVFVDTEGRFGPAGMLHPRRAAIGYDPHRAGDDVKARAHERYLKRKRRMAKGAT